MDIFPTCVTLAGGEVPADRVIDGVDLAPILFDTGPGHRDILCYYRGMRFMAFRKGPWKAHFITQGSYGTKPAEPVEHDPPLLFNLEHDPSEQYNVAEKHPDIVADILAAADRHRAGMDPAPSQLKPRLSEE
jgi:arylsulfatase A-like enzyme